MNPKPGEVYLVDFGFAGKKRPVVRSPLGKISEAALRELKIALRYLLDL